MNRLLGYADPLATRAGETVSFMLSADAATRAEVQLVRLLHGDVNPAGPGFVEQEVASTLPAEIEVVPQAIHRGSYAAVPPSDMLADLPSATLHAFICPSLPGAGEQVLLSCGDGAASGYRLLIGADGRLGMRVGGAELALDRKLVANCWYFVAASWDAETGRMALMQKSRINRWNSKIGPVAPFDFDDSAEGEGVVFVPASGARFLIGASAGDTPSNFYNGKIDRPGVLGGVASADVLAAISEGKGLPAAASVAFWDTTAGYTDTGIGDVIEDITPSKLHAHGVNRPIRAMTGWNWNGREDIFRLDSSQYGGIAFHEDALIDCGWQATLRYSIPADLPSGVYALRIRSGEAEDHVPFFVRAAQPKAPIAVLMPTFTYLAYANEHLAFDAPIAQAICANTPVVTPEELQWKEAEEFGLSTYDVHSDYAGVCYSSWRRPILNMRPRYRMPATGVPWAFPADLSLIWWLDHSRYDFEILTDHDLDREGLDALRPYRAVLTGTHPEYYSSSMLDATEDYLASGGHLLYLGGNGYYWVTAVRPEEPWCIEVRKLDVGSRAWQAAAGEGYLATTGERSGLWRSRGRPPQKIVGVGFTTEGMDESQPFERLPDSFDPEVAWIFDGIGENELIGDFGLGLGGAAGLELDRYDLALGTPPHAHLLAASFNHSDNYPLVSEEVAYAFPGRGGTQDPQVRGDIVYFTTPEGGSVFAAGSIAWSQALPVNGGQNNVSRILANVLSHFVRPQN